MKEDRRFPTENQVCRVGRVLDRRGENPLLDGTSEPENSPELTTLHDDCHIVGARADGDAAA